jgi:hypothetical protein
MIKLLIGPALAGIVWLAGSYYGHDAEQLVQKSPDAVYGALSNMVDGSLERDAGITRDDGGRIETDLKLAAFDPGKSMSIQLLFDGQPGASADVTLTPAQGGKATLIAVKLHSDHAVLREKLAGTSQARLAYAPDWLLNLTFRPVLRALGEDIEKEQGFASILGGESDADRQAKLSPDQQREMEQWQQYEAAQPSVDPNADAQKYLRGN